MVLFLLDTTTSNIGGSQFYGPLSPISQSASHAPPAVLVQHSPSASVTSANFLGPYAQYNNTGISTSSRSNDSNPFRCEFCHSQPKLSDSSGLYRYCSRTCASKAEMGGRAPAMRSQPSQMTLLAGDNCDFCFARPKYFDGTKTHPFCSRTCAKNAKGLTNSNARRHSMFLDAQPLIAAVTCRAPNCQNPVYTNIDGSLGEYCSAAHKILGHNLRAMCLEIPAGRVTFGLRSLDVTDPDYVHIDRKFIDGWQHPNKTRPSIRTIFKIDAPPSYYADYFQHRNRVLGDMSGGSPNEQLLFHGTDRACSLGEGRTSTNLCLRPDCYLCCIIRNSFDVERCGTSNKFCRFGTGIYTTSVSSKADNYVRNVSGNTGTRTLLLSWVIVGNPMYCTRDAPNLVSPPSGYHSIIGERGMNLKYEETVVYNNDAIRPAFLITYGEEFGVPTKFPSRQKLVKARKLSKKY